VIKKKDSFPQTNKQDKITAALPFISVFGKINYGTTVKKGSFRL
jgi:hypothetical protein